MFVADQVNNRVLGYDLGSNNTPTDATADYVIGQPNFTSGDCNQGGSPTAGTLCFPAGIEIDPISHNLFVADVGNHRILIYNLDSLNIPTDTTADYVIGQPNFTSGDCNNGYGEGSTGADALCDPADLSIDSYNHRLFAIDISNNRILVYDLDDANLPTDSSADTLIGSATFASTNEFISPEQSNLHYPFGMAYNPANNRLYVPDYNNRIMIFNLINLPTSVASGTVGSSYSSTVAASQSQGTVSYALASGSLPAGVTLNSSTGALTGTPTTVGDYSFSITATDDNGAIGSFADTKSYVLGIAAAASTGSGSTVTNTIKKVVSFAQSLFEDEDTTDEVVVTDTADLPSTPTTNNSRPTPAPTIDPEVSDLTLVWWLGGGISLFLILIGLGVLVLKKSKSEN